MPLLPASATGRRAALAALAGLVPARGAAAAEPAPRGATPDGLGARSGLLIFRAALPGGFGLTLVPSSHAPDARLPRISSEAVLRGASRLLIETEAPPEGIPPEWTLFRPGEPAPPPAAVAAQPKWECCPADLGTLCVSYRGAGYGRMAS